MFRIKKFIEHIVEGILFISSSITSLTVLLIIAFLFKEGAGLFNHPSMEKGNVIAVNADNPVKFLKARQIKRYF